jgi:hypothetical protein
MRILAWLLHFFSFACLTYLITVLLERKRVLRKLLIGERSWEERKENGLKMYWDVGFRRSELR